MKHYQMDGACSYVERGGGVAYSVLVRKLMT